MFEAYGAEKEMEEGNLALGCLQNLMIGDRNCVDEFNSYGGRQRLRDVCSNSQSLSPATVSVIHAIEELADRKQHQIQQQSCTPRLVGKLCTVHEASVTLSLLSLSLQWVK